jgi:hypothetical protein
MQTEMIHTYLRFYGTQTSMDLINKHLICSTNNFQDKEINYIVYEERIKYGVPLLGYYELGIGY